MNVLVDIQALKLSVNQMIESIGSTKLAVTSLIERIDLMESKLDSTIPEKIEVSAKETSLSMQETLVNTINKCREETVSSLKSTIQEVRYSSNRNVPVLTYYDRVL